MIVNFGGIHFDHVLFSAVSSVLGIYEGINNYFLKELMNEYHCHLSLTHKNREQNVILLCLGSMRKEKLGVLLKLLSLIG